MIFKGHKANIQQILRLIPDNLLSKLALNTKVDYCAKILQGERLFYLLLYVILRSERISQRYLEDVFKTNHFKFLFNYSVDLKVSPHAGAGLQICAKQRKSENEIKIIV